MSHLFPLVQFKGTGHREDVRLGTCFVAVGASVFRDVQLERLSAEVEETKEEGERGGGVGDGDATQGEDEPSRQGAGYGEDLQEEELLVELPTGVTYSLSATAVDAFILEPAEMAKGDFNCRDTNESAPETYGNKERGWAIGVSLKLKGKETKTGVEEAVLRGHCLVLYAELIEKLGIKVQPVGSLADVTDAAHCTAMVWDDLAAKAGVIEVAGDASFVKKNRGRGSCKKHRRSQDGD